MHCSTCDRCIFSESTELSFVKIIVELGFFDHFSCDVNFFLQMGNTEKKDNLLFLGIFIRQIQKIACLYMYTIHVYVKKYTDEIVSSFIPKDLLSYLKTLIFLRYFAEYTDLFQIFVFTSRNICLNHIRSRGISQWGSLLI